MIILQTRDLPYNQGTASLHGITKTPNTFLCQYRNDKFLLPAALRAAHRAGICFIQRPIFRFFAPAGATRCTEGPLLRAKFHPIGAMIGV